MAIGLAAAVPCVALPWALGGPERGKPLGQRYWVKANLWVALFSFVGNYFWTHYFYELLGAAYTFPSWRLNGVRGLPPPRCCGHSMPCQPWHHPTALHGGMRRAKDTRTCVNERQGACAPLCTPMALPPCHAVTLRPTHLSTDSAQRPYRPRYCWTPL